MIVRTTDGGNTWKRQPVATQSQLMGVAFRGANHGGAVGVGGMVLRTADGGETWTTPTESSLQQDVRASALER